VGEGSLDGYDARERGESWATVEAVMGTGFEDIEAGHAG
jgi:hypothetical protein